MITRCTGPGQSSRLRVQVAGYQQPTTDPDDAIIIRRPVDVGYASLGAKIRACEYLQ